MTEALIKKLSKAKFNLLLRPGTAFINSIGLSLDMLIDSSIPTACTNGKYIKWNPEFLDSLTLEETIFVYMHECLHVAYLHTASHAEDISKGFNLGLLNVAQDYRINYDIKLMNIAPIPHKGLFDPKYTQSWTSYDIYKDLLANADTGESDAFFSGSNHVEPSDGASRQEVLGLLAKAIAAAQQAGEASSIPQEIKLMVDTYLNPKIPTYRLIQQAMVQSLRRKIDPNKRSRRYPDIHIPAKQRKKEANIYIYLDVSGSVTDDEIATCLREVQLASRLEGISKITLVQFDTKVNQVDTITSSEDVNNISVCGRGGTCITPVLEHIKSKKPTLSFIYTDGHFAMQELQSRSKIVWCINNNSGFTAPYGKVIHYDASA